MHGARDAIGAYVVSWTVLISATGELGAVASRVDVLQAIANAVKCDVRELDVEAHPSSIGTGRLFAVNHRGERVGEFWPDDAP